MKISGDDPESAGFAKEELRRLHEVGLFDWHPREKGWWTLTSKDAAGVAEVVGGRAFETAAAMAH
jgi:hypothetical protein